MKRPARPPATLLRWHRARPLRTPDPRGQPGSAVGEIVRRDRLGGSVHEYERRAARVRRHYAHLTRRSASARSRRRAGRERGELAEPFARLDAACREVGGDPAMLPRTVNVAITFAGPGADMAGVRERALRGSAKEIARDLRAFGAAGASLVKCTVDDGAQRGALTRLPVLTARGLERFAPVVEAPRKIEAAA